MLGRLDDHFVRADAVHAVEHALALAIQFAFDAQRRKLVGHYAQVQPGVLGPPPLRPYAKTSGGVFYSLP